MTQRVLSPEEMPRGETETVGSDGLLEVDATLTEVDHGRRRVMRERAQHDARLW